MYRSTSLIPARRYFLLLLALMVWGLASADRLAAQEGRRIELIYNVKSDTPLDIDRLAAVLNSRIESITKGRHTVRWKDEGASVRVVVGDLSAEQLARCKKLIIAPGVLKFRIVAARGIDEKLIQLAQARADATELRDEDGKLVGHWATFDPERVAPDDSSVTRQVGDAHQMLLVDGELTLNGSDLQNVVIDRNAAARPALGGTLTPAGGRKMLKLSGDHLPNPDTGAARRMAIELDGQLLTAPYIRAQIGERFVITGDFSDDEIRHLRDVLVSGQLPGVLVGPVSETVLQP